MYATLLRSSNHCLTGKAEQVNWHASLPQDSHASRYCSAVQSQITVILVLLTVVQISRLLSNSCQAALRVQTCHRVVHHQCKITAYPLAEPGQASQDLAPLLGSSSSRLPPGSKGGVGGAVQQANQAALHLPPHLGCFGNMLHPGPEGAGHDHR